jgi:hypothetical protein
LLWLALVTPAACEAHAARKFPGGGDRPDGGADLGKARGEIVAVALEQARASLVAPRQQRGIARIRASVLSRSPSCWRLCCSLNRPSGVCSVMSNRYGITLDSEWIKWAATEKVSETVAAAVLLICETRPVHEVVAKLTPGEFERVVDVIHRSPDHFPSGTLAALKSRSPIPATLSPRTLRSDRKSSGGQHPHQD